MAVKLITLRAFMTEISSSIVAANERLLQDSGALNAPRDEDAQPPPCACARAAPLEIKSVRISFSARIANRRLTNTKPVRQDEVLLDFTGEGRHAATNIYGEMLFSGRGEVDMNAWPGGEDAYFPDNIEAPENFPAPEDEDDERST